MDKMNDDDDMMLEHDHLNDMMRSEPPVQERHELDSLENLFTKDDIETKTELTVDQIILINQKRTIAKLLGWKSLNDALDDWMVLMISKDRSGRREFVDGFKSQREHNMMASGGGWMSGIGEKLGLK